MTFLNVEKLQKIHNSNIGECSAPKCNAASIVENALYYKLLRIAGKYYIKLLYGLIITVEIALLVHKCNFKIRWVATEIRDQETECTDGWA